MAEILEQQNNKLTQIDTEIAKAKAELQRFGESPSEDVREEVKKIQEKLADLEKQKADIITESKKQREYSLKEIQDEIKEKGISFTLVKEFLDNLEKVKPENKPFIIGGILSGLNSRGISILGIDGTGKIVLKEGKQDFRSNLNIANHDEVTGYKNLINNYISDGKISISDINKALTFRTSSIDTYIGEKTQNQKLSTSEYAQRLMEKYKIRISGGTIKDIVIGNEEDLKIFKANINNAITDNQADKEFLFAYFDDKFYRKNQNTNENSIDEYKKTSSGNQAEILKGLSELTDEQKYAVGIKNSNEAKELAKKWTKDPLGAIKENINADNIVLSLFVGILGALFGGKKGFIFGSLLGFSGGAGGFAYAGEKLREKMNGEGDDKEGSISEAYNWIKQKLSPIGNFSGEVYEKAEFWYDYNGVKVNDGNGMKDLLDSNFLFLVNKANTEIGIFEKDGKKLSAEEKIKLKEKLNEYYTKLQEKYPDKTENQIKTIIKTKTLGEIVGEVYSDTEEGKKQEDKTKKPEEIKPFTEIGNEGKNPSQVKPSTETKKGIATQKPEKENGSITPFKEI